MKFKLVKHMQQWDTKHTLFVMLPATTEGKIVTQGEPNTVRFELYPALEFLLEDEMMELLDG